MNAPAANIAIALALLAAGCAGPISTAVGRRADVATPPVSAATTAVAATSTREPIVTPRATVVTGVAPNETASGGSPACPAEIATPLFSVLPLELEQFLAFRPLGFMSPPIHVFPAKHSAFSMTRPDAKPVPRPVRSPGRMWVAEIWRAGFSSGGENFQVFTYPCRDVRVYWGHLTTVAPRLRDEFEKAPPVCNSFFEGTTTVTTCRRSGLSIELSAGEEFGTGPDSAGIDFGVIDFRRPPAAFVRLDHYDSYYPYYASPLDYFTPDTRAKLERKTGNVLGNRARTAAPIGGTYMHDLPGTASGNWFLPGKNFRTTTDLSGAIGLASDFADPTQPIIALGTSVRGARMGLYAFPPRESGTINRRFADVPADGKIYCYEGFSREQSPGGMPLTRPPGVLLLSLPTETTLRVEHVNQPACPPDSARAFGTDAATFER